ncbi:hypothetical protein Q3G72_027585 [Acer saccharum]|nr:hypothetical protein Q3G72_027585 [Acer saccharum]
MLIISKKQVSSHFPESQSSTLAKLMMKEKEDLDLSADDNDVHSWLDALNEISILRIRKNFLNKADLPAFSIQSRTWSDRTVDQVVTEVDQERKEWMTGHSLGSHGLEQAQLSFHLARDTVRYTEEHKIDE